MLSLLLARSIRSFILILYHLFSVAICAERADEIFIGAEQRNYILMAVE